jgi:hypothetical protein
MPGGGGLPPPSGEPGDSARPDLQLSGKKKQDPQAEKICDRYQCDVRVKASYGDEACTLRAKGKLTKVKKDKLKPASADLAPGERTNLGLYLTEKTRKKARKALAEGKNV